MNEGQLLNQNLLKESVQKQNFGFSVRINTTLAQMLQDNFMVTSVVCKVWNNSMYSYSKVVQLQANICFHWTCARGFMKDRKAEIYN